MLSGELASYALAKKPTLNASLNSSNQSQLTWNKVKKPNNGYAVFRDGAVYMRLNKKTFSFTDTSVSEGQTYTYQIKTYKAKKKTKKVTQWYNTQTQQWQTAKPAKAYRGKKKTVKKKTYSYSYKNASNAAAVTIRKHDSISVTQNGKEISTGSLTEGKKTILTISTRSGRIPSMYSENSSIASISQGTLFANSPGTTVIHFTVPTDGSWIAAEKTITIIVKKNCTTHDYAPATCTTPKKCKNCGRTEGSALGHSWDGGVVTTPASTTATGVKTFTCTRCGSKKTETIPKLPAIDPYTVPYEYWLGCADDGFAVGDTIDVTDYKGDVHHLKKKGVNSWEDTNYGGTFAITDASQFCIINKNIDGTWIYGGHQMRTYHGATFDVTKLSDNHHLSFDIYEFPIYNCDASKLTVTPDAPVTWRNTYDENKKPITVPYYTKNNHYLAEPYLDGNVFQMSEKMCKVRVCTLPTYTGSGIGVFAETIKFAVTYDGELIGTFSVNTAQSPLGPNWKPTSDGMSPSRQAAYDIALEGVEANGGPKDLDTDLRAIARYINNSGNFRPSQDIYYNGDYAFSMTCSGGVLCLETYAIKKYGQYGFITHEGGGDTHQALRIDSNLNLGPYAAGRSY